MPGTVRRLSRNFLHRIPCLLDGPPQPFIVRLFRVRTVAGFFLKFTLHTAPSIRFTARSTRFWQFSQCIPSIRIFFSPSPGPSSFFFSRTVFPHSHDCKCRQSVINFEKGLWAPSPPGTAVQSASFCIEKRIGLWNKRNITGFPSATSSC